MSMTNEEASNILRLLATEALEGVSRFVKSENFRDKFKQAYEMAIKELERKKGNWIEQEDGWGGYYYDCSVCKESWTTIDGTPSDNGMNFCPNCGADMRGGYSDEKCMDV